MSHVEKTEEPHGKGSFWLGVAIAGGVNVAALAIGVATIFIGVGVIVLMGFAVLQVLWLMPFFLKYKRKGESNTCKGMLLAGGITVLLSATCFANLNLGNMH
jgi:heme/copper-type cytochrome/quinol oxidase subunit 4